MEVRTSVILAGGMSKRFGSDKLFYPVRGKPMLVNVVDSVKEIVDEVIVVTNGEDRAKRIRETLKIPVITDAEAPCSGPVRGVITAGFSGSTLILPADLPWINSNALKELLSSFDGLGDAEVYGVYHREMVESLITLVKEEGPFKAVKEACQLKGARVTDFHRAANSLILLNLESLKEGWRFLDVDRPEDLFPRPWKPQGLEFRYRRLNDHYFRAMNYLKAGNLKEAIESFRLEGLTWDFANVRAHCIKDAKNLAKRL